MRIVVVWAGMLQKTRWVSFIIKCNGKISEIDIVKSEFIIYQMKTNELDYELTFCILFLRCKTFVHSLAVFYLGRGRKDTRRFETFFLPKWAYTEFKEWIQNLFAHLIGVFVVIILCRTVLPKVTFLLQFSVFICMTGFFPSFRDFVIDWNLWWPMF